MPTVAIVTDSASDLPPDVAARDGITVVPLVVSFGAETFRTQRRPDDGRVLGPDDRARRAVPDDRRGRPGRLQDRLRGRLRRPARTPSCACACRATCRGRSSRRRSARSSSRAATSASSTRARRRWATGCWPRSAPGWRARASSADEIEAAIEETKARITLYIGLDTLEYLKRGGRISGARAAVGTMLSIKPIITVENGIVENADRVRTRAKARERVLELLTAQPLEQASLLHTTHADVEEFTAPLRRALGPAARPHPDHGGGTLGRPACRPGLRRRRGDREGPSGPCRR